jgi:phospholipid/cholesterol/gamma-HCH transport system ATP-binding protein
VRQGETVALLGPSGVGKSVLLKHIIGLIKPDTGDVIVDGLNVSLLKRKELSKLRQRIGYVFQNGALFDSMDVADNIRLGITDDELYADWKYCQERVRECLRLVNLQPEVMRKFPAELSGGMRKRAGLARALALDPEILFLDEPTSGLDPISAGDFDALIMALQETLGLTVFMVTHDLDSLYTACDRIIALADGKVIAQGPIDKMLEAEHPWLRAYFHGKRAQARSGAAA